MLLTEISINGTVHRVSVEGHALVHNWKPLIIDFDAPTLSLATDHGGYAKMSYGSITFNPLLFAEDWPPPVSCPIADYYTDSTEAAAELVFLGMAHIKEFDRVGVTYELNGPDFDETWAPRGVGPLTVGQLYQIANYVAGDDFTNVGAASNTTGVIFTATGTAPTVWTNFSVLSPRFNGTLNAVITTILSVVPEITAVNTTYARASSPNVLFTIASERLALNLASDVAAFYSHLLYVSGTTAYLVDMKLDNGADWDLTEFNFFAYPKYQYKKPLAMVESPYAGFAFNQKSSFPYGQKMSVDPYHETGANIEAALADILALENAPRMVFRVPMIAGNFPRLGQKINIPDTGNVSDLLSYIRARKLQFDFVENEITIEGEGAISAP